MGGTFCKCTSTNRNHQLLRNTGAFVIMLLSACSVRSSSSFTAGCMVHPKSCRCVRTALAAWNGGAAVRMSRRPAQRTFTPCNVALGISSPLVHSNNYALPAQTRTHQPQQSQLHAFPEGKNEWNPFDEQSKFSTGTRTDATEFRDFPTQQLQLKEELRRFRKQQSESLNKPAYNIFTNASLDGICESMPMTEEQLLLVRGIGPKKVEMFGTQILMIVSAYKGQLNDGSMEEVVDEGGVEGMESGESSVSKRSDKSSEEKVKRPSKTQLKEELRQYRIQQSASDKPAYTVFTNAALEGIYASLPTTKEELLEVKGIGPKKIEMFGDDILALVSKYANLEGNNDGTDGDKISMVPIRPIRIDPNSLSAEQRRAAEIALGKDRRNVFITGSAGTGKSHLLKYLVQELKQRTNDQGGVQRVGVCAPTGVAAVIVEGNTLHSFFGIGLGSGSASSLLHKVSKNSSAKKRIDETDVLIIDECSMMSSILLEKLDTIAREIRKDGKLRERPFGGMQVIAFGDFFQLPPVDRVDVGNSWNDRSQRAFCFDSNVWSDLGLSENVIELKEVQRQEHGDFVSLLNKVRVGKLQDADIQYLNSKCLISTTNPLPVDGIVPTRLYVLNRDVDSENMCRLNELKSEEIVCRAIDRWKEMMPVGTSVATKKQMKDSIKMEMPDEVRLKVGAQVMLTRNKDLDNNLVNGSRGVIERFVDGEEFLIPVVRFDDGIVTKIPPVESIRYNPDGGKGCLVRLQVPLKLAWAVTIHKSQGSTLTRALLDISSAFEYGQCYVALSRVKSLDGLWLDKPARLNNIMVSPQVLDFFGAHIV